MNVGITGAWPASTAQTRFPASRSRSTSAGVALALLAAPLASASAGRAQDASFGCKVLLCAAATAPGWVGIPYCVPVMQELFRQLARRGPWPVCSEARASGIGYEPYAPCSAGLTPSHGEDGQVAAAGSLCANLSKPQQVCGQGEDTSCRTTYPTVARPIRPDPNFVDLTTSAGPQRFYFSLKGY